MNKLYSREGEIIRAHRKAKGLSQHQVAAMLGVHIRQYQRLEYGERPIGKVNMHLGLSLCRVLGIDPFFLLFGEACKEICAVNPKIKN